jgi:hypothetical protein
MSHAQLHDRPQGHSRVFGHKQHLAANNMGPLLADMPGFACLLQHLWGWLWGQCHWQTWNRLWAAFCVSSSCSAPARLGCGDLQQHANSERLLLHPSSWALQQ